jgi:iron-sulfur cluster assembly accessory protein
MNPQIHITPTTFNRIEEIRSGKNNSRLNLRISVSGGGCSGFKYDLSFDETIKDDDTVFDDCVVTDEISLGFYQVRPLTML